MSYITVQKPPRPLLAQDECFLLRTALLGGLASDETTTTIDLVNPVDKTQTGFSAILSLGISYSAQDQPSNPLPNTGGYAPTKITPSNP